MYIYIICGDIQRNVIVIHKSLHAIYHILLLLTTIRYIPASSNPTNSQLSSLLLPLRHYHYSPFLDGERIFQRTRGWLSHNISLLFFRIVNFNHTSHTLTAQFARMPHIMSRCVDISDLLQCIHRGYAQCIYRDVLPCDMNRSLWTAHHSSVNVSIPRRFCNTLCSLDEKTLI